MPVFTLLVFGDSGYPDGFAPVVEAASETCQALGGCDMGVLVGDNVYESGARTDADFARAWTGPMARWKGEIPPFWVVPGNHDWLAGKPGIARQVAWSEREDRAGWSMRDGHYVVPGTPDWLHLYAVDTVAAFRKPASIQHLIKEAEARHGWEIVFGHHAAWSSGMHDALPLRLAEGHAPSRMEDLFGRFADAGARLSLVGHDHHQELVSRDGVWQLLQGNSAKARPVGRATEGSLFRRGEAYGYSVLQFTERTVTITMYGLEGPVWETVTLKRGPGGWLQRVRSESESEAPIRGAG
jgi:hypothetical protein